jgi:predicted metalloprotease with PDZ domain
MDERRFHGILRGLTLFRENLITEKEFVAWLNRILVEYQINPNAQTATAEILAEKYWESNDYNRLPYTKGALIGFLTDLQIRQKTSGRKQIDDLMKLLISKTDRKKGYDDASLLANFDAVSGANNQQFYNDFILGARVLPVVDILKNSEIIASEQPHDVFELGFVTESGKLERGARIKQVTLQSAIDAGLKTGDELRGFSVAYGKPQEQATFTVQRGDETMQVKYFPKKTNQ